MIQQPELMDNFGVPFYGKAQTDTGVIWWYEMDGERILLIPRFPVTVDAEHGV